MMKRYLLSVAIVAAGFFSSYSQAPVNDICANAVQLTVNGGYVNANNSNTVTNSANPSCGGSSAIKDIWYYFVYTGGNVVVETQLGTNTDTRIAIFTACGGTQLGCNDDFGGTYRSYIALSCSTLVVGNTYIIQAGGYNSVVGAFTIQVTASGIAGCTDPMATNFTPCATSNNGTCVYPILTAQFNQAPTGTNCLNIQYTSTSSGNITGYSWSFPGGTPSTSTAQNPIVSYPSAGTYAATLTVVDATPASSTATNNNVAVVTGEIVTVDITPDSNPSQTSWKMYDNNNVVIAQGTTNDATFCVNNTCHRFEIFDTGGNGLTGGGNYKIYLNGVQVAGGAAFSNTDIRYINCPTGISCDNTITAVLGLNAVPFDNTWFTFTPAENGQYRVSTCSLATCDTKVWIYDYCIMANFDNTNIATYTYNDDFCGVQAEANVFMAGGTTYYVRIGSAGSCAGQSYNALFEFTGPAVGCMDVLACNFNPLASVSGPCYYNGDPNCSNLGPDLVVDEGQMFSSLTSTTINGTDACLVNEGCLQGLGTRQILRFTTRIANIGTQDYYIGVPSASNPQFVFDACHNHYHYAGYAEYLLYNQAGQPLPDIGFKNGFCVLDLSCPSGISAQYSCGNMGITAGCADIYSSSLSCQWIDITDVPAGDYYLVIRTNWDQSPDKLGHYELRYDNNWAQVCIHFDRNPTTNAITGFTKTISACPIIEDCLGTPFGNVYEDCQGNCPGTVLKGDFNSDGLFSELDKETYATTAVAGGAPVTPCNDLNNDGEITAADAAYVANCIHEQEDLGVPVEDYAPCNWDNEFLDASENVTLGVTNLNTANQTFDLYITNPQNEIVGLQLDFSGALISSVESLLPALTWTPEFYPEIGGNTLVVLSEGHTKIPTYASATPIIRIHYASLSSNTVCVSNIVDVINDLIHNTLTTYGNCASAIPNIVANFSASQTSICSGQSVTFTDSSTGGPTGWSWTFAGGTPSTSTAQNPVVTYAAGGTYDVTLVATGPGGSDPEIKTGYIVVGSSVQWFFDGDNDGYGLNSNTISACIAPQGYVAVGGDCADNNGAIRPNAVEVCNNVDDDCDASIDEGFDQDNDGFTTCDGDCNDNNSLAYPGAFELCNGADEDCNGIIDNGYDLDADGFTICNGDCNDGNAAIKPGAAETCNNIDDDCDAAIDEGFDLDNDGYTTCNGDCNDNNSNVKPGAIEVCNSIDDDCDTSIDEGFDLDNDGYTSCGGDCNDNNGNIHPNAVELCNGTDDDCDNSIDEGFDNDADGFTTCNGDCNDNNALVKPGATEVCNTIDDDCDNAVDEGFDLDNDGYTSCSGDCNDNNAAISPNATESCNGVDDNCTGGVDEGFDIDQDGYTVCNGDCNDSNANINPGTNEICGNNADDNCDGIYIGDSPSIVCPENFLIECSLEIPVTAAVAENTCAGDVLAYTDAIVSNDGCTTVIHRTFTLTRGAIVMATCIQVITVIDTTAPVFVPASNVTVSAAPGDLSVVVNFVVSASDNCNLNSVTCTPASGSLFPLGLTTVTCTATDMCGNNATTTFLVQVNSTSTWFQDSDSDGFGNSAQLVVAQNQPVGYVALNGDCNDGNNQVYPGAIEVCNLIDDNCNGTIDEAVDNDNDGFTVCAGDCNDNNPNIKPGGIEVCNLTDDDCDGTIDEGFDADNDGFTACAGDCNDNNNQIYPGKTELCNGVDENCNGVVDDGFDLDSDGYTTCNGDCNDNNASIKPGMTELCNGIDDDCDNLIDENAGPIYYQDFDGDGFGNPNVSVQSCTQPLGYVNNGLDCFDTFANRYPGAIEFCNGSDDDCDGIIDESCSGVANDIRSNAILLDVAPYNNCNTVNSTLAGATVSPESQSIALTGQDVWFKFVAPAMGIRVRVLTNSSDAMIELQNSTGTMLDVENIQPIKGNESLNFGNLTIGQTYFVAVRNYNSALGSGTFSICLTMLPNTSCNSPAGPYSLCNTFKCVSTSAYQYVFNYTSITSSLTYTRTQGSTSCVLSTVTGLPQGDTFNVRTDAVYSVTRGDGSSELITVVGPTTCPMIMSPDVDLSLKSNMVCPSVRSMGSTIRTNNIVCGVTNYQWEFQLSNLSQPVFYVNGGTSYNVLLSTANGFALGQTYNVRVRAQYGNGYSSAWGALKCMVISSTGMIMENEGDMIEADREGEVQVNLYPNPNRGDLMNLYVNELTEGLVYVRITDGLGRVVMSKQFVGEGYLNTLLEFEQLLSAGIYMVEVSFDSEHVVQRILIQN